MADQQLCDKVDAVVAQMREMIRDYRLDGSNTIWCHKIRDWLKVLEGNGLTVDDFAHYKDPKYPEFTVLPPHLSEFLDGQDSRTPTHPHAAHASEHEHQFSCTCCHGAVCPLHDEGIKHCVICGKTVE